jgi:hypothetical protein
VKKLLLVVLLATPAMAVPNPAGVKIDPEVQEGMARSQLNNYLRALEPVNPVPVMIWYRFTGDQMSKESPFPMRDNKRATAWGLPRGKDN